MKNSISAILLALTLAFSAFIAGFYVGQNTGGSDVFISGFHEATKPTVKNTTPAQPAQPTTQPTQPTQPITQPSQPTTQPTQPTQPATDPTLATPLPQSLLRWRISAPSISIRPRRKSWNCCRVLAPRRLRQSFNTEKKSVDTLVLRNCWK